jgi:hypothetical protein
MRTSTAERQKRFYLISALLLVIGLGSASMIFLATDSEQDSDSGYEIVGGHIYPGMNERSKKYMHDLELYGGKAAVIADEINRWFDGLWHGRTLAYTIACISLTTSLGVFGAGFYAHVPHEPHAGREDKDDGDRST